MMNRIIAALLALLVLPACQPKGDARPPLDGATMGGAFVLTDPQGRTVRDTDFAGRYRLVYFGYTYCPDVCPVDMQRLAAAYRLLEKQDGARAVRLQPIFITVDPERDTPQVVGQFVAAFHPKFIGLTGSAADIAAVAKRYRVYYGKDEAKDGVPYRVDHSRITVLYGPKGEPVARIPETGTPQEIADEIRRWMR